MNRSPKYVIAMKNIEAITKARNELARIIERYNSLCNDELDKAYEFLEDAFAKVTMAESLNLVDGDSCDSDSGIDKTPRDIFDNIKAC